MSDLDRLAHAARASDYQAARMQSLIPPTLSPLEAFKVGFFAGSGFWLAALFIFGSPSSF